MPLSGTWNLGSGVVGGGSWTNSSTTFTFGCRGAALAKCVELGYKPWKIVNGVSLRNHHQACVRMIRADYCGDGKPWTQDGTPINVYDSLNIQTDAATYKLDAEWTAGRRALHLQAARLPGRQAGLRDDEEARGLRHVQVRRALINEYKP